jgi:acetate kinase
MGFTPLEGLVMMTRSGNIDAGIVLELVKEFGIEGADKVLNKDSGMKGISGAGNMLELFEKMKLKDKNAQLAFDVFVYSVQKYIGGYFAILGGCDVLVFTGSVGSGNPKTINAVCKGLDILKKTKILTIGTDEELAIAQKIWRNI